MPRPKSIVPNRRFSTTIPELIIDLLLRFFEEKELDLAPFCGTMPGEHIIRGTPAALRALSDRMEV